MLELHRLCSELRDQVIDDPTYSLFWLQPLFFVLTKAFLFESILYVCLMNLYEKLTNFVDVLRLRALSRSGQYGLYGQRNKNRLYLVGSACQVNHHVCCVFILICGSI